MINACDITTFSDDKSEIVNYNNPLFYCFAKQCFYNADSTFIIPEHWHEDIEYLYVIEGKLEYSVNGESITLHAGEGICVNSKRIHSNRSMQGDYCLFYCVILHPSYLCASHYIEQKYVTPVFGPNAFDFLLLKKTDWTAQIIAELQNMFAAPNAEDMELKIIEVSFRILRLLYVNMRSELPLQRNSTQYVNAFKTMVTYIQKHFAEKITLEDIAGAGNVGKTLCAKIFTKFASKTPGDYLIHYRIMKGMELLKESELSVTEISYTTGFNSASHFTKTFKTLIGCTPNKYRNSTEELGGFLKHY